MANQEVIHSNWFQRIYESIKGVPMGFLYIFIASIVLFQGEKKHALTTEVLKFTRLKVINPDSTEYDPTIENQLLILHDTIRPSSKPIQDSMTNTTGTFIKLYRQVKVYQWQETIEKKTHKDNFGGKTDTINYIYTKVWDDKMIDHKKFHDTLAYINPVIKSIQSKEFVTDKVSFGTYTFDKDLTAELNYYSPVENDAFKRADKQYLLAQDTFKCLGVETSSDGAIYSEYQTRGSFLFKGKGTPQDPKIGDLKFIYWGIAPDEYTVIASEKNKILSPLSIADGFVVSELNCGTNFNYGAEKFAIIKKGNLTSAQMYSWADEKNNILFVFGLRLWGFIFMISGFRKVFLPLAILPAWIPFIGKYSGKIVLRFSFLLATSFAFLISGTTWLIYNKFENITQWDYYFVVLLFLMFVGGVSVRASNGDLKADSGEFFED